MNLKNIKYSILELVSLTEGMSISQSYEESLELAQLAEKLGYTRFWFTEHHNIASIASSATSVLICYVAGKTKTIRVGAGGIMLPNHSSLVIAEQFGTLETLYPGRIDLGIGRAPGTDGLTAKALGRIPKLIATQFPRQILELQTYLSEENSTGDVRAIPGEGLDIPIYMLGSSTDSAWLAAELGLPYAFAGHFAPEQMDIAFKIYEDNYKPSKEFPHPYKMASLNIVAADTDAEAEYLATTLYQSYIGLLRGDKKLYQKPVKTMEGLWTKEEESYAKEKLALSLIGSKETIQYKLKKFQETYAVDEIVAVSRIYDKEKRLRSFEIFKSVFKD